MKTGRTRGYSNLHREGQPMKKYRCQGIVPDCHVTFGGEDDQIEAMAVQHVERDHGFSALTEEHHRQIRSNIFAD